MVPKFKKMLLWMTHARSAEYREAATAEAGSVLTMKSTDVQTISVNGHHLKGQLDGYRLKRR
jgi:hypothetical protein